MLALGAKRVSVGVTSSRERAEPRAVPPNSRADVMDMPSHVVNAPVTPNAGGYETRVSLSKPVTAKMAGQNNGGYENRVVQETGTH